MPKIILASASPQRKKLLQLAGVRFTVKKSRIKENNRIVTTCAAMVKANALGKARDVAGRLNEGLVIGADTVVYDGKNGIIGKPRHLKEAKRILKKLFSRPHWVYTGVALVDAASGRRLLDCVKTKIYMDALSDAEIDRYHRLTPPMDKAGGFDIEGRGGLFISRIEGCYTNVIGLPMPRLRTMMARMGVRIL